MSTEVKVFVLPESKREEWDAYIEANSLAIAWQKCEWHDILEKHHPHEFLPLVAAREGKICGVFPLYVLRNKRFRSQFISVPFAVAGGIVADSPEIDRSLLEGALDLAKERGITSMVLKQYKHKIDGDLRTDDTFHNRELSLSPGLDHIWDRLKPQNREMVLAAGGQGFSLEFPSSKIDEFYSVLFSYSHGQGVPCVSKRWIEDLVLSGMYECAVVRRQGRAVAGTLVKSFKKTASFPFTALKKNDSLHAQAAYWLYWELISLFAKRNYEIVHSGRIPADESVPSFRLGWNGTKHTYYYQYHPNTTGSTESSQKRGWKRRLFSKAWRFMPKPAVVLLSPNLIRRFP